MLSVQLKHLTWRHSETGISKKKSPHKSKSIKSIQSEFKCEIVNFYDEGGVFEHIVFSTSFFTSSLSPFQSVKPVSCKSQRQHAINTINEAFTTQTLVAFLTIETFPLAVSSIFQLSDSLPHNYCCMWKAAEIIILKTLCKRKPLIYKMERQTATFYCTWRPACRKIKTYVEKVGQKCADTLRQHKLMLHMHNRFAEVHMWRFP